MKSFDKKTQEYLDENPIQPPLFHVSIGGVSIFINKSLQWGIEAIETEPYERDGKIPLVFIFLGPLELLFYSERLYKYAYVKERGYRPYGLSQGDEE